MGLITEIRKKSRETYAPEIDLTLEETNKLNKGLVILVQDKIGNRFFIRIPAELVGHEISNKDLIIDKYGK